MVGHLLVSMVTDVVGHCLSPSREFYENIETLVNIEVRDLLATLKKSKNWRTLNFGTSSWCDMPNHVPRLGGGDKNVGHAAGISI